MAKKRKRDDSVEELEIEISAPEPPSRKAARRAKKGKDIAPSATDSALTAGNTSETVAKGSTSETEKELERSEFGIWIGNLPFTSTRSDLQNFITTNSSITDEEITRVHLPTTSKSSHKSTATKGKQTASPNRGFAYVDLATSSALDQALALSEKLLTGRRLLIKDAKSFEGRPEKPETAPAQKFVRGETAPSKNVFVGNLSFGTTKEILVEHFEQCGKIKDVQVATFEDTGNCKGYGWVEFQSLEAATAAVRGWIELLGQRELETENGISEGVETRPDDTLGRAHRVGGKKIRRWINMIDGRRLRMEFAEDKAVRYKKRFGINGATKAELGVPEPKNELEPGDLEARGSVDDGGRAARAAARNELNPIQLPVSVDKKSKKKNKKEKRKDKKRDKEKVKKKGKVGKVGRVLPFERKKAKRVSPRRLRILAREQKQREANGQ